MARLDWEIHHVNVKSAYLNAPLKERVYMKKPRGATGHGKRGKVCCLLKGMYGLKQAGRGWHQELTKVFVQDMKFMWSEVDHSVFYKKGIEEHTIIAIATDDMIVTSQWIVDVQEFKAQVQKHWEITDMGDIQWYLGFEIKWDRNARTASINQCAYIDSITSGCSIHSWDPLAIHSEPWSASLGSGQARYHIPSCNKGLVVDF